MIRELVEAFCEGIKPSKREPSDAIRPPNRELVEAFCEAMRPPKRFCPHCGQKMPTGSRRPLT